MSRIYQASITIFLLAAACTSSVDGNGLEIQPLDDGGGQSGLDYAWSRPSSPQALADAGYTFVARYLSYDTTGKNLSASEAQGLIAAGVDIVANWEWAADDALDGYDTGVSDAQQAQALATGCGMPSDRPIYFSVDFDASPDQQAAINDYFDGVASVLGVARTGAYGGYYVIQRLFDAGKIQWGWQTYAWSGGQWDSRAQLRQIQNGVTVAGADGDIDQSEAADFGQWGATAPTTTGAEASQAFVSPDEQHYFFIDSTGTLQHSWWDGNANALQHDQWGNGVVGNPVSLLAGPDQHVFARSTTGDLQHWFWDPNGGLQFNQWGSGLADDPAAMLIGGFQDVWATDAAGNLQHWFWGPNSNGVQHDTWGSGVTGRPSVLLYHGQQHVFARGTGGTLEHYWWDPNAGIQHDTWGSGLASDPVAEPVGDFQDVWAIDGSGNLMQFFWGPSTNGVQQTAWGSGVTGRPTVLLAGAQQHVFARGTSGTLEHFYWDPNTGITHDTWGSGIAADPTALLIDSQEHVWAEDSTGVTQHWYWDPSTNMITHDNWGQ
ncbi:MAG TPA: glycoside hydrolase domain-containing protein [Kofleriaceae bacterium]